MCLQDTGRAFTDSRVVVHLLLFICFCVGFFRVQLFWHGSSNFCCGPAYLAGRARKVPDMVQGMWRRTFGLSGRIADSIIRPTL